MTNNEKKLQDFLDEFSLERLKSLQIFEYTGIGEDRKDFTYQIEWELDCFGGIRGGSSYKFGIYKCNSRPKERKGYRYDEQNGYAWVENYNTNGSYKDVFEIVRDRVFQIASAAAGEAVDYDKIEKIDLGDAFKWKVAFLYSNYRLVPVYKKDSLYNAAKLLGFEGDKKSSIAKLQKWLKEEFYEKHKEEYCPKDENGIFKDAEGIIRFGTFVWKIGSSELFQNNQIIKYGAPGTGKTYTARQEAEEFFKIWKSDAQNSKEVFADHYEFVQFHPSYSYEDFIEGIKPVLKDGKTELKLTNGIFKSFCKKAAKYELWLLENGILQPNEKNRQLNSVTVKEVKMKRMKMKNLNLRKKVKQMKRIIYYRLKK